MIKTEMYTYSLHGAISYNACQDNHFKVKMSGQNDGNGKVDLCFIE